MNDTKGKIVFGLRQWVELLLGAAALAVSAISLWVAIGTEQANRQMVAASSWPLLLVDTADVPENGRGLITFSLINGGVGPAKLKTMELWWRGRPYTGALSLLRDCCGYKPLSPDARVGAAARDAVITGGVHNVVIRAGEKHDFLRMPLTADNATAWSKLDRVRHELKFRGCYCSVFDECWIGSLMDLEPKKVDSCPVPKVLYVE
ncbi:MAG TPA: hypothetical protein VGM17_13130 [Rhizomicrobium sp.]|jgi:hypothetical protein